VTAALLRPGAAPGPGGPPQPAQQSKRLQQTQAQVDEVHDASQSMQLYTHAHHFCLQYNTVKVFKTPGKIR